MDLFASGWQVAVRSITVQASPHALRDSDTLINFNNCTAIFQTSIPYIALPKELVQQLIAQYPVNPVDMTIACSDRASLPTLKIGLGNHKLTLSPFDYVLELPDLEAGDAMLCSVPFGYLPPYQEGHPEYIVLGSAFLHGLYSVFDVDNRTIGCKFSVSFHC